MTATEKTKDETQRPVFLYDGDCAFCREKVSRWQRKTKEAVLYRPYQDCETNPDGTLQKFPSLSREACRKAVQLVFPDGRVVSGAEAVFRLFALSGRGRWLLFAYTHVPGFSRVAEFVYQFVARHRS